MPPQWAQQWVHHPTTASGIVYMYLLVPLTPAQQPHSIIHPHPPIWHPWHINHLPAHLKDPITNPNQPQHHGDTLFFLGGGQVLLWIYDLC